MLCLFSGFTQLGENEMGFKEGNKKSVAGSGQYYTKILLIVIQHNRNTKSENKGDDCIKNLRRFTILYTVQLW